MKSTPKLSFEESLKILDNVEGTDLSEEKVARLIEVIDSYSGPSPNQQTPEPIIAPPEPPSIDIHEVLDDLEFEPSPEPDPSMGRFWAFAAILGIIFLSLLLYSSTKTEKKQPITKKTKHHVIIGKSNDYHMAGSRVKVMDGMYARYIPKGTFFPSYVTANTKNEIATTKKIKTTLTRSYWMLETEVTRQQFDALGLYGLGVRRIYGRDICFEKTNKCPVAVPWNLAALYANKLSLHTGIKPEELCFSCQGSRFNAQCKIKSKKDYLACKAWRLPSVAEWKRAAKADEFNKRKNLDKQAWHSINSKNKLHAVRLKGPNKWGLFDIYGNLFEWASDRGPMKLKPVTQLVNPFWRTGPLRDVCGGVFHADANLFGSRCVMSVDKNAKNPQIIGSIGVRLVKTTTR